MRPTRRSVRGFLTPAAALLALLLLWTGRTARGQDSTPTSGLGGSTFRCEMQTAFTSQGKTWGIHIDAATNLPKGTHLLISVLYCDEVIQSSWNRVFVNGPSFARDLGPFDRRPFSGTYTVRVSCELDRQEPEPYFALQDAGDLEFTAPVFIGSHEDELTEDRAYLEWIAKARTTLQEKLDDLFARYQRAMNRQEFRTADGGFDAFACIRWMDGWIAAIQQLNADAAQFSGDALTPKYPKWTRVIAEGVTGAVEQGCARVNQMFRVNGAPAPSKYNVGGGVIVESAGGIPLPQLATLQDIVSQLTVRVHDEEKALHETKNPK